MGQCQIIVEALAYFNQRLFRGLCAVQPGYPFLICLVKVRVDFYQLPSVGQLVGSQELLHALQFLRLLSFRFPEDFPQTFHVLLAHAVLAEQAGNLLQAVFQRCGTFVHAPELTLINLGEGRNTLGNPVRQGKEVAHHPQIFLMEERTDLRHVGQGCGFPHVQSNQPVQKTRLVRIGNIPDFFLYEGFRVPLPLPGDLVNALHVEIVAELAKQDFLLQARATVPFRYQLIQIFPVRLF